jgi:hypothetical protein
MAVSPRGATEPRRPGSFFQQTARRMPQHEKMHALPTIRRDSLATRSKRVPCALDLFVGTMCPGEALLQGIDHFICAPRAIVYASREKVPFLYIVRSGLVKLSHFSWGGADRRIGGRRGLEALFGEPYHHTAWP